MADYVIERTHVIDHERFLAAGAIARDLWEWGMKWSGRHEKDGKIPMHAVLASPWGYGGKANIKAATKLVEVGLWERTDDGFLILRWAEQGNKTHAELEAAREKWRKKKKIQRESVPPEPPTECPQGTTEGTLARVLNSTSYSSSGSGSPGGAGGAPGRAPDWWLDALATAGDTVGNIAEGEARWLEYDASRERKGWARNHRDAVGWLCAVVRTEKRNAKAPTTRQPLENMDSWLPKTGTGGDQ